MTDDELEKAMVAWHNQVHKMTHLKRRGNIDGRDEIVTSTVIAVPGRTSELPALNGGC